jgi:hypothetical protein
VGHRTRATVSGHYAPCLSVATRHAAVKQPALHPPMPVVATANVTVHRAAVNDVDFRTRAARSSVCNGLLSRNSETNLQSELPWYAPAEYVSS